MTNTVSCPRVSKSVKPQLAPGENINSNVNNITLLFTDILITKDFLMWINSKDTPPRLNMLYFAMQELILGIAINIFHTGINYLLFHKY